MPIRQHVLYNSVLCTAGRHFIVVRGASEVSANLGSGCVPNIQLQCHDMNMGIAVCQHDH